MHDLRHAIKGLVRHPGFTVLSILTLALGIGGSTAMFSVINAVFLAPLPYKDSSRLMVITERDEKHNQVQPYSLSYVNFQDWRDSQNSFEQLALFRGSLTFKITGRERSLLTARMVSANFLSILGVKPILGRDFNRDDDRPGATPVMILSYSGWLRVFGPQRMGQVSIVDSSSLLGEKLRFNDTTYQVIGILPREFTFYTADSNQNADVYIPIGLSTDAWTLERFRRPGISALGRLKPNVSTAAASGELESIARQLATMYPDANENRGAAVEPILSTIVRQDLRSTLFLLAVAVALVLLIAIANVTNLALVRATTRHKEIAIRFALGGSWHVVRHLFTESLLLSAGGGAGGLLVAIICTDLLVVSAPIGLPRIANIGLDWNVFAFSVAISILTGIIFGAAPVLQSLRANILSELKEGGTSSAAGRHAAQKVIIIGEIALAMILLVGAGRVLRSTQKALSGDPGFDPKDIWSFAVLVSPPDFPTASDRRALLKNVESRFSALDGVRAVSAGTGGLPKPIAVDQAYPQLMGIRLMKGRFFDERDSHSAPPVIVIDETLARARFRDEDPIGKPFVIDLPGVRALQLDRPREVIGVVSHIQRLGIESDDETVIQSQFYLAADQLPDELMESISPRVLIKTNWKEEQIADRLIATVHALNPNLEASAPIKMQDAVERALLPRRFVSRLFGVFAASAFALAGVGIFSLMSYTVSQRSQEIGIRMALGAESTHIVKMVLRQATILAAAGIGLGLVASLWLKRLVEQLLFDVSTTDPLTYVAAISLLFAVAIVAASIPALRVSRREPMLALRQGNPGLKPAGYHIGANTIDANTSSAPGLSCIEVSNLQMTYRTLRGKPAKALAGVSFRVAPGTIFGLIGQNGAGKTTLVKILMGLATPTSGSAKLLGCSPGDSVAKGRIGYLPEHMKIPQHFVAESFLRYMGQLNGVDSETLEARIPILLEKVGLGGVDKYVKSFSKGMQQRLGIAQALLNDPELLFLDEPTDGLDPLGRIFVRDLLVQLRDAGKTVFLNSHLLSEIELVCDQIVILDKGLVACKTTPAEFGSGAGEYFIRIAEADETLSSKVMDVARSVIGSAAWHEQALRFRPKDVNQLNDLLDALRAIRAPIVSVEPVKLSLEQFFIQVVGEKES